MSAITSRFRSSCVAALALLVAPAIIAGAPQGSNERSVYVMVTDAQNKPIKGLPAEAFAIREDNIDREVTKAVPATDPMAVIVLADTTSAFVPYPRDLRVATAAFMKRLLSASPQSAVALWEFGGADIPVENFTSDSSKLEEATNKLFPKGSLSDVDLSGSAVKRGQNIVGSNLLEGVNDAAKQLAKRPEARRIIFSFNHDLSVENSNLPGEQVQSSVQKANATLFAVSIQNNPSNGPLRDNVLDGLAPYSGGRRITILAIQALAATLENAADILSSEYLVSYARPKSDSPKQVLVGIKVQGAKASTARWAPK